MYKFLKEYHRIKHDIELTIEYWRILFFDFIACLKYWWNERPRLVECEFCKTKFWYPGRQDAPTFCDDYCAYEGLALDDKDIPF